MNARARSAALGVAVMVGALPLRAQLSAGLSAAVEVAPVRMARSTTVDRVLAGPLVGAQGRIAFRLLEIEGRYAEGTLTPSEGTSGLSEDLVEGTAVLWFTPLPWLAVGAGPQLRAFLSSSGTSHWTRADLRMRLRTEVIPALAVAHVEGWVAAVATSNVQGGGNGALGAEAGLTMRIPRLPVSARLGYVADRATFANGGTEFLEGIRLSLLVGPF